MASAARGSLPSGGAGGGPGGGGFPSRKVKPDIRESRAFRRFCAPAVVAAAATGSKRPTTATCGGIIRRPTRLATDGLLYIYRRCDSRFSYRPKYSAPKRVLTNPSIPRHNEGFDNENYDLILHVGDVLGSAVSGDQAPFCWKQATRYSVIDMLGQGTFGQVVKCKDEENGSGAIVAVKVLKNKPAYFKQGLLEVGVLTAVNTNCDPTGERKTVRFYDHFMYQNHLCLVFELLSMNLFELIKQNGFRGISARLIRIFVRQIIEAMGVMDAGGIVHCDLKPENVLLENLKELNVKLIDFGSACFEKSTLYTYIQSRHYRSPEVILGLQYTCAIDMWSLGCIAAELFLGIPIFPGANEYNQLHKISDMLGHPPESMIAVGTRSHKFYKPDPARSGGFVFKTPAEYEKDQNVRLEPDKKYFRYRTLDEIVDQLPMKSGYSNSDDYMVRELRASFKHFLKGLLQLDPAKRWTADQAKEHPFITEAPFSGDWQPPPPRKPFAPGVLPAYAKGGSAASSSSRAPIDVCGAYHKFTTALRAGQVIDAAKADVLALLNSPINPPPTSSSEYQEQQAAAHRFRSQSDAFSHPVLSASQPAACSHQSPSSPLVGPSTTLSSSSRILPLQQSLNGLRQPTIPTASAHMAEPAQVLSSRKMSSASNLPMLLTTSAMPHGQAQLVSVPIQPLPPPVAQPIQVPGTSQIPQQGLTAPRLPVAQGGYRKASCSMGEYMARKDKRLSPRRERERAKSKLSTVSTHGDAAMTDGSSGEDADGDAHMTTSLTPVAGKMSPKPTSQMLPNPTTTVVQARAPGLSGPPPSSWGGFPLVDSAEHAPVQSWDSSKHHSLQPRGPYISAVAPNYGTTHMMVDQQPDSVLTSPLTHPVQMTAQPPPIELGSSVGAGTGSLMTSPPKMFLGGGQPVPMMLSTSQPAVGQQGQLTGPPLSIVMRLDPTSRFLPPP